MSHPFQKHYDRSLWRTALICSDRIPFARQYVPQDAVVLKADDVNGFAKAMRKLLQDDKDRIARAYRLAEKVRPLDWRIQTAEFLNHLKRRGFGLTRTNARPGVTRDRR